MVVGHTLSANRGGMQVRLRVPTVVQGGCRLVPHGTSGRKFPDGVRVRRYLCPQSGQTVSLLPNCLAPYWSGMLAGRHRAGGARGRSGPLPVSGGQPAPVP